MDGRLNVEPGLCSGCIHARLKSGPVDSPRRIPLPKPALPPDGTIGRLIEYAHHVITWLIVLVVSIVGVSFALAHARARRESQVDLGRVSQSWITEQRAGQHRDWS